MRIDGEELAYLPGADLFKAGSTMPVFAIDTSPLRSKPAPLILLGRPTARSGDFFNTFDSEIAVRIRDVVPDARTIEARG